MAGWRWLPKPLRSWMRRPVRATSVRSPLPWWGLLLHTKDKAVLEALLESGVRIAQTMATPGWRDVEAVVYDWLDRYTEQARTLGQQMEEREGHLVLREEDTPADDRRRLIACAQAAALKGLLAEVKQRAKAHQMIGRRDAELREAEELNELV